ncbi:MAG: type VI secretion system lipoprotein TssJ [Pseudomonadota bacterium]
MIRRLAILAIAGAVIGACAPPPEQKQPDPTVAQVTINAAADANPDPTGRPSPAVVFLYALQPGSPFPTAGFDDLAGGELGEMAETTKRIAKLVLVPGKSSKKIFELPEGTSDIGIVVSYRNIDEAKWRGMAAVTPKEVTLLTATIGSNAVAIE